MTEPAGMGFVVARIGRPHGLRGEATVQVHTDDAERRFVVGAQFATEPPDAGPVTVCSVRVHQGRYLLAFTGYGDRSAAEALRGVRLVVPDEDVFSAETEDDAWREDELLGLRVTLPDGTVVGEVSALHTREVQDLLEVRLTNGSTAWVPFVTDLVPDVDVAARRIVIDPPVGLLELGE